jgi:hypothetical protein
MWRGLLALIVAAAGAGTCAHKSLAEDEPDVIAAADGYRAWIEKLPRCDVRKAATDVNTVTATPEENPDAGAPPEARRKSQTRTRTEPQPVAVRGVVRLEKDPLCTAMRCPGAECCNRCFPRWVLISADLPTPDWPYASEIAIRKAGDSEPLGMGIRDCKLRGLRKRIPRAEVIVEGMFHQEILGTTVVSMMITDASICLAAIR